MSAPKVRPRTVSPRRDTPPRRSRGSSWQSWLAMLVTAVGAFIIVVATEREVSLASREPAPSAGPTSPVAETSVPLPSPTASPSPSAPLLRMPGPVPSAGSGTFAYAEGDGEVLGTSGTLRRYRVAVEKGSGVDVEEFAEAVDRALGDPRSWIASGRLRLQRVPDGSRHDFTIYLATARTAGRMCAEGGIDIRVGGKPYTSCRVSGRVIINLDRWHLSVDHLVEQGVPLATYRDYVINHEVGHELGHGHEGCPGRGKLAPTMMQQTLYLDGCVANPWPYLDGKRYAGPPR